MRIDAEQMHQLQCREDIGSRKESLGDELRIEVVPLLTRNERTQRILRDFRGLLYVGKETREAERRKEE